MSKRLTFPEEKSKRIAVAATVAAVLAVVVLAIILVIQFVSIGELNARKAQLDETKKALIEENETLTEQYMDLLDARYKAAYRDGWRKDS